MLVIASCRPQPYCEYTPCMKDDDYCYAPVEDCPSEPEMVALTEYTRWFCLDVGYVWDNSGWLCDCW